MVFIVTMNAHSYIDAHSYMEDRITDACAHRRRARVLRACARACGCAFGRARIRAEPCEPLPSAWTACGSARRRSTRRRRSTPTSAHGTPRRSPRWSRYAPLPARRRATAGVPDALGRAPMRRGRLCAAGPPMRAHARTCRHSSARASTCVAMAGRRRDSIYVHVYVYMYVYTHIIHILYL